MARKSKRRKLDTKRERSKETDDIFKAPPLAPATEEEKEAWEGWCELESEPALFNVMLREYGVSGVKVQEIWSIDDEACLALLPRPIFGLIFLFRWSDIDGVDEAGEEEEHDHETECKHKESNGADAIWFANQVAANSCAAVALLNVLNNADDIDLGDQLQTFKNSTADLKPHERGITLSEFAFVRAIHNSFARKMDMLVSDLALKDEIAKSKKASATDEVEEEPGFHFIAFVPVKGKVWKFDGFDEEPQNLGNLGDCDSDWLEIARPVIQSRMMAYETSQIEFSLLSVVRDPSSSLPAELARNVKALNAVWMALELASSSASPGTTVLDRSDFPGLDGVVWSAASEYGLDKTAIEAAEIPEALLLQIAQCSSRAEFSAVLDNFASDQFSIRGRIVEERHSRASEEDLAARRRHDYGPAVYRWLQMLHKKGELDSLLEESQAKST